MNEMIEEKDVLGPTVLRKRKARAAAAQKLYNLPKNISHVRPALLPHYSQQQDAGQATLRMAS